MDDQQIVATINRLADEEHELERQAASQQLDEDGHQKLAALEVQLDQCWDLLRQRRARRDAGADPDGAEVRSAGTVEGYQQ